MQLIDDKVWISCLCSSSLTASCLGIRFVKGKTKRQRHFIICLSGVGPLGHLIASLNATVGLEQSTPLSPMEAHRGDFPAVVLFGPTFRVGLGSVSLRMTRAIVL